MERFKNGFARHVSDCGEGLTSGEVQKGVVLNPVDDSTLKINLTGEERREIQDMGIHKLLFWAG